MSIALSFTERQALARRLIAGGRHGAHYPEHIQDQLEAAADECQADLYRLGRVVVLVEPERRWWQRQACDDDPERRALLLAAVLDCMPMRCPHLRKGGPQPAFARLPLRRLDCRRCVGILRRPPPEDADRCDVCGRRGVATFFAFAVAVGPTLISGDACAVCAGVLGIREAAA